MRKLDRKFAAQERKIALVVNNGSAQLIVAGLKAIELILLSPNTTLKTQLMDQGVVRTLKAFHCYSITKRYITSVDRGRSPAKVSILWP